MQTRSTTLIGVLLGAVLVLALAGGAFAAMSLQQPTPAQAQAGVAGMRQITVIGNGEVRVAPDMATVQIGVETSAPTTQEALAQNTAQAQAIIDQMKQLGIDDKDLQTSGFSISPTYDTNGRAVTGYQVSNMVMVTIRDLDNAGTLLDQVVQSGANRIYGINFGLSDLKTAQAQARDAAILDGRDRADQMARTSGATLGTVLVITENVGSASPFPMLDMAMSARGEALGAPVPVQPGEQVITAQVQLTYELR
ncbi:SIMPL domain-containing protein [Candidatus Chloroploca sp. M-50]|uniref:SIMPL domain-containing protein n=1 Tax=Candidatus Chloroploca mongolica TaxID=2528176 RepID=A0ABS4D4E6_9CHLR|nr:SIMPL domain-containing protein [Candidatus Chloroploca mongolica]MBP1464318.1 SIMPL domain-containing protein [Candidatus Chloroploca mongolica]